jgi:TRAP-type mannitol/chloroaromatic compound transport system, large permease component
MLLAASTGIVGATVVTMGLLSLPSMIKRDYAQSLSTGVIAASGTLGQIIPPSIVLVLLGDVLSSAYTDAQTSQGAWSIETISVGDLFVGAIVPGLILVSSYLLYVLIVSFLNPESMPSQTESSTTKRISLGVLITVLFPPLFLILAVLGSIIFGLATITEAAGVGAAGAVLLAYSKDALDRKSLKSVSEDTAKLTTMVFMILIGASVFSLVFRGYEGDELVQSYLTAVPGGTFGIVLVCDDCDVYPWLRSGFYKNYIHCGPDCCSNLSSAWVWTQYGLE